MVYRYLPGGSDENEIHSRQPVAVLKLNEPFGALSASATKYTATIRTFARKEIKDQVGCTLSVPQGERVACAQLICYIKSLSFLPSLLF